MQKYVRAADFSWLILKLWMKDGMVLCHLPEGPTAHFKVSSVRLRKEMKARWDLFFLWPDWIRSNMKTLLTCICSWKKCFPQRLFKLWHLHRAPTCKALDFFLSAETRKRSDWTLSRSDSQQLHNSSGSQHRPNVCCSLPTKTAVFGSTGCHLPQPERLHLFQIPQVS